MKNGNCIPGALTISQVFAKYCTTEALLEAIQWSEYLYVSCFIKADIMATLQIS